MLALFRARSLFARVFGHGLLVLFASAGTFLGLSFLLVRPVLDRQLLRLGAWAAPHLCSELLKDAPSARVSGFVASAYSTSGKLIRSFHTPPFPPLPADDLARLRVEKAIAFAGPHPGPCMAYLCEQAGGGAYVEFGPPPIESMLLLELAIVVIVVGLASIPFARSIARPIAQLARVTQAFGTGELAVRSDIARTDEVGELARAFNQMADRVQRVIRAEQELLANVSHELRTPLARMRVVLETALENPPRAEHLLQEIAQDLGDLERLVEAVMEAVRLDMATSSASGTLLPARLESMDVVAAVRDAVTRFRALHSERRIAVEVDGEARDGYADPRLVRRLFDNLLDNAHKYSEPASSITIRVATQGASQELIGIEVIDRGTGIDSADLPHVFEPFFRSARGRSRDARGAGLGLALAKRIVDAHGGRIAVTSELGVGTCVHVVLRRCSKA